MRKILFAIVFTVAVAAALLVAFGDAVARASWQRGWPNTALLFDRSDADLALTIGSHYFGAPRYDLDLAASAYRKALRIDAKSPLAHYQLARIYFVQGKFDGAIGEANRELEANAFNARSLYIRGLAYGFLKRYDRAEEDFSKFVRWAPTEWAGYNDLAWVLIAGGKSNEAEAVLADAIEENPEFGANPWLLNNFGIAEMDLNDYRHAALAFARARHFAKRLTIEDWRRAYPGNNPADLAGGLEKFNQSVDANLARAKSLSANSLP